MNWKEEDKLIKTLEAFEKRMATIEKYLMSQKEYLTLEEVAFYLNIKMDTVYSLTSVKTWPTFKPGGKIIYVKREDVDRWIEESRRKSDDELNRDADNYLLRNKRA